jgi:hypothetical protein
MMKQSSTSLNTEEKFREYTNKVYLCELERRLQYCLRNLQIACKAVHVAILVGELK